MTLKAVIAAAVKGNLNTLRALLTSGQPAVPGDSQPERRGSYGSEHLPLSLPTPGGPRTVKYPTCPIWSVLEETVERVRPMHGSALQQQACRHSAATTVAALGSMGG